MKIMYSFCRVGMFVGVTGKVCAIFSLIWKAYCTLWRTSILHFWLVHILTLQKATVLKKSATPQCDEKPFLLPAQPECTMTREDTSTSVYSEVTVLARQYDIAFTRLECRFKDCIEGWP